MDIRHEIADQSLDGGERIRLFDAVDVPVVALRAFIVVTHDPFARPAIVKPVLATVTATVNRLTPYARQSSLTVHTPVS